ncbi:beta-catenin-like protein 1 [Culicoides brevitarsis]|uniref:beta-catenin-like protein 1 n=1 Tax=Culicoides brevitarsis TaxID=469753 RepID=UPI00307C4D61
MDIGELLSFKPEQTPKRSNDDDYGEEESPAPSKRSRKSGSKGAFPIPDLPEHSSRQPSKPATPRDYVAELNAAATNVISDKERLEILRYVDEEEATGDVLDEPGLKKLLLLLEKRILKNQEMRIKNPDQPDKFMESELDLHDILQQLTVVSTVPDLYPLLVELHGVSSLLELLNHPNSDISVGVVDLIQEMTDIDILHESAEGSETLIEALRGQQISSLLTSNLDRLDESVKEEADGVHNTLAIFENLLEMKPEMCIEAAEQGLMQWILKRIKVKSPFDPNKLYCSEILSILIQDTNENRILLGNLDGIDVLLQQLATYKRHDPNSTEEQEYMENLFNCLCSSLMLKENRDKFLKGEGLQLMNLMLREKKLSRNGALKVLDYALSGVDGRDNCNKFVDILGLRTIFPLFMKTPKNKKRVMTTDEHEEHVCSIISSMLKNCKAAQRQRLLAKFTENEFEKVDRLLELHMKYLEKVEQVDRELDQEQNDEEEEDDEAIYLKRLSGGLFTLQLIDYIIVEICATGDAIKQRVVKILNLRNASMKTIRTIMREYAGNLGDAGEQDSRKQEQDHILQLVDRF